MENNTKHMEKSFYNYNSIGTQFVTKETIKIFNFYALFLNPIYKLY